MNYVYYVDFILCLHAPCTFLMKQIIFLFYIMMNIILIKVAYLYGRYTLLVQLAHPTLAYRNVLKPPINKLITILL